MSRDFFPISFCLFFFLHHHVIMHQSPCIFCKIKIKILFLTNLFLFCKLILGLINQSLPPYLIFKETPKINLGIFIKLLKLFGKNLIFILQNPSLYFFSLFSFSFSSLLFSLYLFWKIAKLSEISNRPGDTFQPIFSLPLPSLLAQVLPLSLSSRTEEHAHGVSHHHGTAPLDRKSVV